jgi:hypothetical protein
MTDYSFFNMGRIGADAVDNTQRNIYNTRFANYTLSSFFSENVSDSHVSFATTQPNVMFSGVSGVGVNSVGVDVDSVMRLNRTKERSLEKLQLNERPFLTVPYLGKGSCNPTLESQLLQGEHSNDKKSVSTIMTKSFMDYSLYPTDDKMKEQVDNPAHIIQEYALDGWVRGGILTRELAGDADFRKESQPNGVPSR